MTATLLLTGGTGQVARSLLDLPPPAGCRWHAPPRAECDLRDAAAVRALIAARGYAGVVNCAAFTAVDRAETHLVDAFAANAIGPAALAQAAAEAGIPLVHLSTDYVFDGQGSEPYREDAPVNPLNVYGASKLAGELAVSRSGARHVILRTAWVVSPYGQNFVRTMLRLAADRDAVRVVDDQHGCPTAAADIAAAVRHIVTALLSDGNAPTGTFHFVNAGSTSWAGLARAVFARAAALGGPGARVDPIASSDYPTPARRPANSRLATGKLERDFGIVPRPWPDAIGDVVDRLLAPAAP